MSIVGKRSQSILLSGLYHQEQTAGAVGRGHSAGAVGRRQEQGRSRTQENATTLNSARSSAVCSCLLLLVSCKTTAPTLMVRAMFLRSFLNGITDGTYRKEQEQATNDEVNCLKAPRISKPFARVGLAERAENSHLVWT